MALQALSGKNRPRGCTLRATEMRADAHQLATLLSGCWRSPPPPVDLPAGALDWSRRDILTGGLSGLVWRRMRYSGAIGAAAEELHNAYRYQALGQRRQEIELGRLVGALTTGGVESIVLKGWAVARLYPDPALRPFGDVDLAVAPQQLTLAQEVVRSAEHVRLDVDLHHADLAILGTWEALVGRSRLVPLDDIQVRVLCPEDQLAHLCLHFLRHSGERPLWLVDIAAAVEDRGSDFDWNLCLGSDPWRADAIACAIGVAHQILGADVKGTPVAERAGNLPRWLVPAVLRQWEKPPFREFITGTLVRATLRRPWTVPRELAERWPDPLRATTQLRAPFNDVPRLPFQAAAFLTRAAGVLRRVRSLVAQR